MASDADAEALDRAWDALEAGEPRRAIELSEAASERLAEVWILRARAWLDEGELARARAALERAARCDDADDFDLAVTRADVALREWRIDEARSALERARAIEPAPEVLAQLALVCDLAGEFARADRWLAEARRADPEAYPRPPRMSEAEFERCVAEAAAQLPPEFQAALARAQLIVEPMPRRELLAGDLAPTPPDMLGLFTGASDLERSIDSSELPPAIHLFQRNIERAARDRAELVDEIRVTLYHELAHLLGFDEAGVEDLGLE
jgi:predicted Zn-dependent protease with MMP-like domain